MKNEKGFVLVNVYYAAEHLLPILICDATIAY